MAVGESAQDQAGGAERHGGREGEEGREREEGKKGESVKEEIPTAAECAAGPGPLHCPPEWLWVGES